MALNSIVDISTPHLSGLKERKMEELLSCVCCIFLLLLVLVMAASIKVLLQRNILRRNTREKRWKFVFSGGGVSFQFDKGKKMKRRNQMASKGNAAADGLN